MTSDNRISTLKRPQSLNSSYLIRRQQSLPLKNLPYFVKTSRNVSLREPYLAQSLNVCKLTATLFEKKQLALVNPSRP